MSTPLLDNPKVREDLQREFESSESLIVATPCGTGKTLGTLRYVWDNSKKATWVNRTIKGVRQAKEILKNAKTLHSEEDSDLSTGFSKGIHCLDGSESIITTMATFNQDFLALKESHIKKNRDFFVIDESENLTFSREISSETFFLCSAVLAASENDPHLAAKNFSKTFEVIVNKPGKIAVEVYMRRFTGLSQLSMWEDFNPEEEYKIDKIIPIIGESACRAFKFHTKKNAVNFYKETCNTYVGDLEKIPEKIEKRLELLLKIIKDSQSRNREDCCCSLSPIIKGRLTVKFYPVKDLLKSGIKVILLDATAKAMKGASLANGICWNIFETEAERAKANFYTLHSPCLTQNLGDLEEFDDESIRKIIENWIKISCDTVKQVSKSGIVVVPKHLSGEIRRAYRKNHRKLFDIKIERKIQCYDIVGIIQKRLGSKYKVLNYQSGELRGSNDLQNYQSIFFLGRHIPNINSLDDRSRSLGFRSVSKGGVDLNLHVASDLAQAIMRTSARKNPNVPINVYLSLDWFYDPYKKKYRNWSLISKIEESGNFEIINKKNLLTEPSIVCMASHLVPDSVSSLLGIKRSKNTHRNLIKPFDKYIRSIYQAVFGKSKRTIIGLPIEIKDSCKENNYKKSVSLAGKIVPIYNFQRQIETINKTSNFAKIKLNVEKSKIEIVTFWEKVKKLASISPSNLKKENKMVDPTKAPYSNVVDQVLRVLDHDNYLYNDRSGRLKLFWNIMQLDGIQMSRLESIYRTAGSAQELLDRYGMLRARIIHEFLFCEFFNEFWDNEKKAFKINPPTSSKYEQAVILDLLVSLEDKFGCKLTKDAVKQYTLIYEPSDRVMSSLGYKNGYWVELATQEISKLLKYDNTANDPFASGELEPIHGYNMNDLLHEKYEAAPSDYWQKMYKSNGRA